MTDLCQRIAFWALQFQPDVQLLAMARQYLRDYAGCVAAGSQRAELAPALMLARSGSIAVWGRAETFDAPSAALLYGTAGSLLQLHDVYAPAGIHPGCAVISAALVAHALRPVPAVTLLRAIVVGYEICNRIGDACQPGQSQAGSTPTATAGALGATVAAGLISGYDAPAIARALSLATMLAPQMPGVAVRAHAEAVPLHGGLAARAAIEAMLLAPATGALPSVLEGDGRMAGFLSLLRGEASRVQPESWDGSSLQAVIGKRWPACFGSYAALEAVLSLPRAPEAAIRSLRVGLPGRLLPIIETGPAAGGLYDRLMSVRWALARTLEQGSLDWRHVDDEPATRRLAARISVYHDVALDSFSAQVLAANIELDTGAVQRCEWRRALSAPGESTVCSTMRHDQPQWWQAKFVDLTGATPEVVCSVDALLSEG
jgi:2-methylcitrate dehydratase PrpD